MKLTHQREE